MEEELKYKQMIEDRTKLENRRRSNLSDVPGAGVAVPNKPPVAGAGVDPNNPPAEGAEVEPNNPPAG